MFNKVCAIYLRLTTDKKIAKELKGIDQSKLADEGVC